MSTAEQARGGISRSEKEKAIHDLESKSHPSTYSSMPVTKRNEFLDAGSSEDEDVGSGFEEQESRAARAPKRRKIERDEDEAELGDSGYEHAEDASDIDDVDDLNESDDDLGNDHLASTAHPDAPNRSIKAASTTSTKHAKPSLTTTTTHLRSLAPAPSAEHKTGVIYLSRIPPFLKPSALRTLLSPFGTVLRIFLTPEPATSYSARKRSGGNKKRSYTDGWAEFASKRDAKTCAAALNAQLVGGKKGGWYHDDVWNLRYLKGFKWRHLTEQIANENAEREARLRKEIGEARREDRRFLENVERAKTVEGIKRTREEKRKGKESGAQEEEQKGTKKERTGGGEGTAKRQFAFAQSRLAPSVAAKNAPLKEQPEEVKRVLSKIF